MSAIGALLGLVAASGVLLVASAWLWPPAGVRRRPGVLDRAGAVLRARLSQAGMPGVTPGVFVAVSLVAGAVAGLAMLGAAAMAVANFARRRNRGGKHSK